jgi:hypothetical protein
MAIHRVWMTDRWAEKKMTGIQMGRQIDEQTNRWVDMYYE